MNIDKIEFESETFPIVVSKGYKIINYILYLLLLLLDFFCILFTSATNFWILPVIMISITAFIVITLELNLLLFTPIEVQFSNYSIFFKFRLNRIKEKKIWNIQWLNLWSEDKFVGAFGSVKFVGGESSYALSYESALSLKKRYQLLMGKKPMNSDEHYNFTKSLESCGQGPSE
jgi:hypothetical protein